MTTKKVTVSDVDGVAIDDRFYVPQSMLTDEDLKAIGEDASIVAYNTATRFEVGQVFGIHPHTVIQNGDHIAVEVMSLSDQQDIELPVSDAFKELLSSANDAGFMWVIFSKNLPRIYADLKPGNVYRSPHGELVKVVEIDGTVVELKTLPQGFATQEPIDYFYMILENGAPYYQYIDYRTEKEG